MKNPRSLIRPLVRSLHAYVPGEQPKIPNLIKLNTNENPYPPSPGVLRAVREAVDERLRLYPDPTAEQLREKLARMHGCRTSQVIIGNGSDELLALAVRAFVEPARLRQTAAARSRATVQYPWPCYSLYPVLAEAHGARARAVPLKENYDLPPVSVLRREGHWDFRAALTFVTTPNAPSGRGYSLSQLDDLCRAQKGVVVLDEAYVDFASANALSLTEKHPHVLIARTFSKAYSLCFQRIGYFIGHEALISALHSIRDSYNVNGLGQVAAQATLNELAHYHRNFCKIIATRERLWRELTGLGFEVLPSQTNFLLCKPPGPTAEEWLSALRDRHVLVRWFRLPELARFLRITVGTDREVNALLKAVRDVIHGTRNENCRFGS
ncbi:MAG: histidinol-phosphate transaminase [Pedosphaera sp.]|nr:histidinol-phosphate transaminase [Pedosphaera sp.]